MKTIHKLFCAIAIIAGIQLQTKSQVVITCQIIQKGAHTLVFSISDAPGMTLASVHYSINNSTCSNPAGSCLRGVDINTKSSDGKWVYTAQDSINVNDVVYFWLYDIVNGIGGQLLNQTYTYTASNGGTTGSCSWQTSTNYNYTTCPVGIGITTQPTEVLDVKGNIKLLSKTATTGSLSGKSISALIGNNSTTGRLSILTSPSNDNMVTGPFLELYGAGEQWEANKTARNGDITMGSYNTGDIQFVNFNPSTSWQPSDLKMIIQHDGKVGIGVQIPSQQLEVNGTAKTSGLISPTLTGTITTDRFVIAGNTNSQTGAFIEMYGNAIPSYSNFVGRSGELALGSYGSGDIGFYNYNGDWGTAKKMVITSAGNVAIGTTPYANAKLTVSGSVYLPAGNSFWIGASTDAGSRLRLHNNGTDAFIDYATNLHIRTGSIGTMTDMVFVGSDGKVGIGESNPSEKLEVAGNLKLEYATVLGGKNEAYIVGSGINNVSDGTGRLTILQNPPDPSNVNNVTGPFIEMYGANEPWTDPKFFRNGDLSIGSFGTGCIRFYNYTTGTGYGGYNQSMFINNNGQLIIGTTKVPNFTKTGYLVAVGGKMVAEEVDILLQEDWIWPDYVFDKNHKLMDLKDVETYVNTNGHLLNVPSATEVKNKGISVGKMDATLLEKIEEMTLYMIELNKKIDEQQKEIEQLKQKN